MGRKDLIMKLAVERVQIKFMDGEKMPGRIEACVTDHNRLSTVCYFCMAV